MYLFQLFAKSSNTVWSILLGQFKIGFTYLYPAVLKLQVLFFMLFVDPTRFGKFSKFIFGESSVEIFWTWNFY